MVATGTTQEPAVPPSPPATTQRAGNMQPGPTDVSQAPLSAANGLQAPRSLPVATPVAV